MEFFVESDSVGFGTALCRRRSKVGMAKIPLTESILCGQEQKNLLARRYRYQFFCTDLLLSGKIKAAGALPDSSGRFHSGRLETLMSHRAGHRSVICRHRQNANHHQRLYFGARSIFGRACVHIPGGASFGANRIMAASARFGLFVWSDFLLIRILPTPLT